jgi:hypothetical protein
MTLILNEIPHITESTVPKTPLKSLMKTGKHAHPRPHAREKKSHVNDLHLK